MLGDDGLYRERAALLRELKAAYLEQARLFQELSDLATAQAAYSRYLIQTKARRPSLCLTDAISEFMADFRQRAQVIQADLKAIHHRVKRILAELDRLRETT